MLVPQVVILSEGFLSDLFIDWSTEVDEAKTVVVLCQSLE